VPLNLHQFRLEMNLNIRMVVSRRLEFMQKILRVRAFQGKKQLPGQPSQRTFPFHQIGVEALIRQGQRRAHAGHPTP
jgi:hypothetical protein